MKDEGKQGKEQDGPQEKKKKEAALKLTKANELIIQQAELQDTDMMEE